MNKSNELFDSFTGKGTVTKKLIDKSTGKVVEESTDHNLIVKAGRSAMINMLAGELQSSVKKMAVGCKGTADLGVNAFTPIKPEDGDTALKEQKGMVEVASRKPRLTETNPQVTFVALFDCATVDSLVNECGLFFEDGQTMFARHTFDTVSLKSTSNFSLEISWTIEF